MKKIKKPLIHILDTILFLFIVLEGIGYFIKYLIWIIFESGYSFYIRLICAFELLFVVLFAIIILIGFLMHLFRKKSKGNTEDRKDRTT